MSNATKAPENENPGALAGATGVEVEAGQLPENYSGDDLHAIHLATASAIRAMCRAGSSHFTAAVAWGALKELVPDDAARVAALFLPAGSPLPTFETPMADARFWAALASADELSAYAAVCFERLPPQRQADFAAFIHQRVAA